MSAVQRLLILAGAAAITVSTHASRAAESAAPSMYGFTRAGAVAQAALERRFDGQLNAAEIGSWLKQLSAAPNHVGAPHNKANAEYVRDLFKSWGWQADIETFYVLYPTPKRVALELIAPKTFTASLREPPIAGDATSTRTDGLPPYNAYGADGDVIGDLVYVNYGMDDDYKELARLGIDVKGKIAIVRYGGGWRGLKPKLAYQHGAIGCLIYSDPRMMATGWGTYIQVVAGVPPMPCSAARSPICRLCGRSAHAGCRSHQDGQTPVAGRGADRSQDPGAADLICRCASAARMQ